MRIVSFLAVIGLSNGFVVPPAGINEPAATAAARTTTSLNLDASIVTEMGAARGAFGLCFFGAAGSASLGREVLPKTWNHYWGVQALKGKGAAPSGGEEFGMVGYPEPVYAEDIRKVVNNRISVAEMNKKYPIEGTFPGYFHFESMAAANEKVAPLVAVRAVYDTLSTGINKDQINSIVATEQLELYKNDLDLIKKNLLVSKAVGLSAFFLLLGLLGLADYFTIFHLWHGWFPEWQGFDAMPGSLFDERGILSLPNYFYLGIPEPDL